MPGCFPSAVGKDLPPVGGLSDDDSNDYMDKEYEAKVKRHPEVTVFYKLLAGTESVPAEPEKPEFTLATPILR